QIVQELINMDKYIIETMDNIEICKSVLKLDKQITFAVTFEGNKATLSLLEKLSYEANFSINSGTYSNINEYVLDSVETSGEINRNAIYTRWHIGSFEGNVVDIFNCDDAILEKYFGIVNRFKYLLHANTVLLNKESQIEEIESGYANEMFDVINHYPKLQDAVMKQIAETLKQKKDAISINKPNFAKTFNELLDNAIQSNLGVLEEQEKQAFQTEQRNVVVNLNVKRAEIIDFEKISYEDKKDAEFAPKIIKIKTDNNYQNKSITELGEEFVGAYRKTTEINQEENKDNEKGKLVATLVGAGLGATIGGSVGAVAGAVVGNLVAEVAEKVSEAKKEVKKAPVKTPAGNAKSPAKKDGGKKAGGGGKSAGSGGKPSGGKKDGGKKKDDKDNKQEETKPQRRLLPTLTRTVGDKLEKEATVKIDAISPEELVKMEKEMIARERKEQIAKEITGSVVAKTVVKQETTKLDANGKLVVENITTSLILQGEKANQSKTLPQNLNNDKLDNNDLTL
ncbi:MAG: hypothetical protein IKY10_00690, partial [Clostridia bacterium]|nr:hypothetical protein [Clostridia bacterium]